MTPKFQYTDKVEVVGNDEQIARYGKSGFVMDVTLKNGAYFYTLSNRDRVTIQDVPEEILSFADSDIHEKVESRLVLAQKNKEFKDTGVRVRGSKKEQRGYDLIRSEDLDDIEQDEITAIKLVVKDKVYPEVNVQAERDNGVSSGAAFLKKSVRDAMAAKPENDKTKRKIYVSFITKLVSDLAPLKTISEITNHFESLEKLSTREVVMIGMSGIDVDLSDPEIVKKMEPGIHLLEIKYRYPGTFMRGLVGEMFGMRFRNLIFRSSDAGKLTIQQADSYDGVTQEQEDLNLIKWDSDIEARVSYNEAIAMKYRSYSTDELKRKAGDWTHSDPAWKKDPELFRSWAVDHYEKMALRAKGLMGKLPPNKKARPEDWSWFESPKERKQSERKTDLVINQGKPLSFIKRIGGLAVDYVSPEKVMNDFGFRAVEFGKWVKDSEAKEHVRHFLGAMLDLSEILNFDIKAINKLGGLAIAFGSRGSGKAMAFYMPGRTIINITKNRGDGTVAHEWAHYLDNAMAMHGHDGVMLQMGTESELIKNQAVSDKVKAILSFIRKRSPQHQEMIRRMYLARPSGVAPVLYGASHGKVEIKIYDTIEETIQNVQQLAPNLMTAAAEYERIRSTIYGYIIHKFGISEYMVPLRPSASAYFYYSSQIGSPYWVKPAELFARAWECYVYDKLVRAGRFNNYLVSGDMFNLPQKVYPFGSERDHLFDLYDELIDAIRVQYNISGFVPTTSQRKDEFIALDDKIKEEKAVAGVVVPSDVVVPEAIPVIETVTPSIEKELPLSAQGEEDRIKFIKKRIKLMKMILPSSPNPDMIRKRIAALQIVIKSI